MTMRFVCLAVALVACTRSPEPIGAINPIIGDTSFIRAFGRLPTPADDPTLRVATHLAYVANRLRAADAPAPDLRAPRARLLDELDRYIAARRFPGSETDRGLLPAFVDPRTGARCAVAALVEATAGTALVDAIDRDYHNAYIAEIARDDRFAAWAARSGLTRDELAMIQPAYPPRPPLDLQVGVAADAEAAVDRDATDPAPRALALVRGFVRWTGDHNRWIGEPVVELDAAGGATDPGGNAYDVHARIGSQAHFYPRNGRAHLAGITGGIGVDAAGAIARAWTVPVDGFYRVHADANDKLVGIHGGPRLALANRALGWNAGLDFTWRDLVSSPASYVPRDLRISLDVTGLAGTTFVGLVVGFVARTRFDYWAPAG